MAHPKSWAFPCSERTRASTRRSRIAFICSSSHIRRFGYICGKNNRRRTQTFRIKHPLKNSGKNLGLKSCSGIIPVMVEKNRVIEIHEADVGAIWQKMFVQMSRLAEIRKKSVTDFAPSGGFYVYPEPVNIAPVHGLRVNPAATTAEGKPRIIVVDATYYNKPTQQIVLEAEWNGNEPTITVNNPSKIHGAKSVLPYGALGALATAIIEHRIEHAIWETLAEHSPIAPEAEQPNPSFYIRMPDDYSKRVN